METIRRAAAGGLVGGRLDTNCAYGPNTAANEYTEVGGALVTHDLAGNLTGDHRRYSYVYDYENRIIEIRKSAGTELVASYEYDALGRRIEKYDVFRNLRERNYYDGQRAVVKALVNTAGSEGDTWSFVYGNYIDEVLMMIYPGNYYCFYAHDHLYSPVTLTFETSVIERYEYDAYGKPTFYSASWGTYDSFQTISNIGFTGRELDVLDNGSLEIMYYRARYYDPETGRFMQRDPLGLRVENYFLPLLQFFDSRNLYNYVTSNPLMYNDPTGLLGSRTGCECGTYLHIKTCHIIDKSWESLTNGHTGVLRLILALLEGMGSGTAAGAGTIADLVSSVKYFEARGLWKEKHIWVDYECVDKTKWSPINSGEKIKKQKGEKVNLDANGEEAWGLNNEQLKEWVESQLAAIEKVAIDSIPSECKDGHLRGIITKSKHYEWFDDDRKLEDENVFAQ